MEITTDRLVLREFLPTDLDSVQEYASDPEVVKYMPFGPNTVEDSKNFIARAIGYQTQNPRKNFELAITLRTSGQLIGGCGIRNISDIEASMGYIFNKNHWGKGYATEASKALVDFGFSEMNVHRIHATCDPENGASRRVLEKSGMILEGRLRENIAIHGRLRDSLILSILVHEHQPK